MNKLLPAAVLLALSAPAFAQMPPAEGLMKELDTNKDGVISKEEAASTPLKDAFDTIDTNHDGKITLEELKAWRPPAL